jgi:hypothetical protein
VNQQERAREEANEKHWKEKFTGAVKEAIGELLMRRAKRIIQNTDRLADLGICPDDRQFLTDLIVEALELEGCSEPLDLHGATTVSEFAEALCAAFIPKAEAVS